MSSLSAHVIEDDLVIRELLQQTLLRLGFEKISTSRSYLAAKNNVSSIVADVTFVDIELGDGNGLDLISSLKKQQPDMKVIVISSYATPANVKTAIEKGADSFLSKPFNLERFKNALSKSGIKCG